MKEKDYFPVVTIARVNHSCPKSGQRLHSRTTEKMQVRFYKKDI